MDRDADIVFNIAEEVLGFSKEDVLKKSRKPEYVDAKRMVSLVLERNTDKGPYRIGKILDVDHSTICHYKNTHQNLMDTDNEFKSKFIKMEVNFIIGIKNLDINLQLKLDERERINKEIEVLRKKIRLRDKFKKEGEIIV